MDPSVRNGIPGFAAYLSLPMFDQTRCAVPFVTPGWHEPVDLDAAAGDCFLHKGVRTAARGRHAKHEMLGLWRIRVMSCMSEADLVPQCLA